MLPPETQTPTEDRLNKWLAHAGLGSRRHCEDLILAGRVSVDGQKVRELGTRVIPGQRVAVDGVEVKTEKLVYWLVNKPRGYLCTNHDPAGRPRAIDLVPNTDQRVYTVGRLDEGSEGLLLLTNDGDLAYRLMHPRFAALRRPTWSRLRKRGTGASEDLRQLLTGVSGSAMYHVRVRTASRSSSGKAKAPGCGSR